MAEPITQTPRKIYLSDGAYVDLDEQTGTVKLTTENGIEVGNVIYLDPVGMAQLIKWWEIICG